MQATELAQRLKKKTAPLVIDVRTGGEYRVGHIPGALHAPSWRMLLRRVELPADKATPLVVTCEHGPRALVARGLLGLLGYRRVELLEGHMKAWRMAKLPMVQGPARG
jgi:rhodanese-related sulfurtransferase